MAVFQWKKTTEASVLNCVLFTVLEYFTEENFLAHHGDYSL